MHGGDAFVPASGTAIYDSDGIRRYNALLLLYVIDPVPIGLLGALTLPNFAGNHVNNPISDPTHSCKGSRTLELPKSWS